MNLDTQNIETQETEAPPTEPAAEETAEPTTEAAPESAEAKGEAPEGEAKDDAETADGEDEEAKEAAAEKEKRGHRRPGPWQRKVEKLERERALLLEQLARGQQPPAVKPAKEKTKEEIEEEKAAEYLDRLVDRRIQERDGQRQQQAIVADFQRRAAEVRAEHPDFDDVVMNSDAPLSDALQVALLTSEHGPAIMYELAKSPDVLARISALPPLEAAREVGRLEAKLASGTTTPKAGAGKPAARKPAPAPITPVSSRGPTTVKPVSQMTQEEYNAWRDGQGKR